MSKNNDYATALCAGSASAPLLAASPKAGYLAHKNEIDDAIHAVLDSGWYILGEEVARFEEEFARYVGAESSVGTGSGTDALELALRACGIGPGDAVVTVSHTAVATVSAIHLAGAIPVLVDIDPTTFTLDLDRLETTLNSTIGGRIRAIVPVHLYGHPVDMSAMIKITGRRGLYVIEDCAQAHGATWQDRKVGSFGHLAAFSFYPTKNLGALGDGGALTVNDAALGQKARLLRQYGWKQRYISEVPGMNSRLDELQAAVLRVKLRYLDRENGRRRTIANTYNGLLSGSRFILPQESCGAAHVYHQYVVRCSRREDLRAFLRRNSVETAVLYPVPVHLQQGYRDLVVIGAGGVPETEKVCHEILSLPMYPELTDSQVSIVSEHMLAWERGDVV